MSEFGILKDLMDYFPQGLQLFVACVGLGILVVLGLCKAVAFLNPNKIEKTLLSQGDRKKQRFLSNVLYLLFFSVISFSAGLCGYAMSGILDEIKEKLDPLKYDADATILLIESILGAIFIVIIPIIVAIVLVNSAKASEKKVGGNKKTWKQVQTWILFFLSFSFMGLSILVGLLATITDYMIYGTLLSLMFGVLVMTGITESNRDLINDVAELKIQYKGKELYLFGVVNNCYVAADSRVMSECSEYCLINVSDFKGPFYDVKNCKEENPKEEEKKEEIKENNKEVNDKESA